MLKYCIIFFNLIAISISSQNFSNLNNTIKLNENNFTNFNISILCRNISDCNYGTCNNKTLLCECNYRYIHTENNGLLIPCSYQLKKQYNTFILELIVGFGAGQFYSNRYVHGFLKLLAYLFAILSICLFPLTLNKMHNSIYEQVVACSIAFFYCGLAVGFTVWYIYDLVMIKNSKYLDGNGYPLFK